jgi:hypothetical protein
MISCSTAAALVLETAYSVMRRWCPPEGRALEPPQG